ncbi:MAG TPA: hypothetical protein VF418_13440 [Sphingomonadaceae bacterium]
MASAGWPRPGNEAECYKPDWIEMALAHQDEDEVRGAYNSALYLTPRKRMLQDWANMIEKDAYGLPKKQFRQPLRAPRSCLQDCRQPVMLPIAQGSGQPQVKLNITNFCDISGSMTGSLGATIPNFGTATTLQQAIDADTEPAGHRRRKCL